MIVVLKFVVVVFIVLLAVATALRVRKLRRDEFRESVRPTERRLVKPPPSPYAPSKGFRLLDDSGEPLARPAIERPRLDPDRHYVFSELSTADQEVVSSPRRHKDDWFLSRSSHRSTLSNVLRWVVVILMMVLALAVVVTYYTHHHSSKVPGAASSDATSTLAATTTTVSFPTSFRPTATIGEDASYSVPTSRYQVVVTGALGATWARYEMGPNNTLEWQGTIAKGRHESLTMSGNSRITLGSPTNAAVDVGGATVVFPSPLPGLTGQSCLATMRKDLPGGHYFFLTI